jgi:hypothetical protein
MVKASLLNLLCASLAHDIVRDLGCEGSFLISSVVYTEGADDNWEILSYFSPISRYCLENTL